MTAIRTPVLGIVNERDNPHHNWVAVLYEKVKQPGKYFYHYVPPIGPTGIERECDDPDGFTPLADFCVHAHLTPDARLALHHIQTALPAARYSDGRVRYWQGVASTAIDVHWRVAGFVMRAIQLDYETRRAGTAQPENRNTNPS